MNFRVKARLDFTLIVEVEEEDGISEEEEKEGLTDHIEEILSQASNAIYGLEADILNTFILEEETQIHVEVEREDD